MVSVDDQFRKGIILRRRGEERRGFRS